MISINDRPIGKGYPVYIVAEIGINHNGDIEIAKKMIDVAIKSGVDAVKFQKRTPEVCTPPEQQKMTKETPWGTMNYLDYRRHLEFGQDEYEQIDSYCKNKITWFASCWDKDSVDFIDQFNPPCYKIASACLTDDDLLKHTRSKGKPILLSTGMSTMEQIYAAMAVLGPQDLVILHCVSTYPCAPEELNLKMISRLQELISPPIGYSGHEVGLAASIAAVALGACVIERHLTLDRTMWGSDQAASVEPQGFAHLVRDIRVVESALGDGVKVVSEKEKIIMKKLRRVL